MGNTLHRQIPSDPGQRKIRKGAPAQGYQGGIELFCSLYRGEYQNIIAPLGKHSIDVITSRGIQKNPQQLSRATVEQLFLALRFGYMVNYAENNEVLPVIMDDILRTPDFSEFIVDPACR